MKKPFYQWIQYTRSNSYQPRTLARKGGRITLLGVSISRVMKKSFFLMWYGLFKPRREDAHADAVLVNDIKNRGKYRQGVSRS